MDEVANSLMKINAICRAQQMLIDHLISAHLTIEEQTSDVKIKMYRDYIAILSKELKVE